MGPGTSFKPVIEYGSASKDIKTVILSSGKIKYPIQDLIKENKKEKTTLSLTIEELSPFPEQQIKEILEKIPKNSKIIWA